MLLLRGEVSVYICIQVRVQRGVGVIVEIFVSNCFSVQSKTCQFIE